MFKKNPLKLNISNILIYLLSLTPFLSAIIYYIYALNNLALIFLGISLLFSVYLLLPKRIKKENNFKDLFIINKYSISIFILFALSVTTAFIVMFQNITINSITSPFETLNYYFFIFYSLSFIFLFILNTSNKIGVFWKILSNIFFYFLSFSLLIISLKLNYGFDAFIHQASMDYISLKGYILPKNPFYIGQYGLIIFLSKLTGLSIAFLNKTIVIILSSIMLPISLFKYLKSINKEKNTIIIPLLLILGFSIFTFTTPQNLSYLFLMLSIFYSLSEKDLKKSLFFALSTTAIHPLSGLPAIAFFLFSLWQKKKNKLNNNFKKISLLLIFIFNSLSIPISLYISTNLNISLSQLKENLFFYLNQIFNFSLQTEANIFLNTVYFFKNNYILFLLIFLIFSLLYIKRKAKNNKRYRNILEISILSISSLFVSFLITSSLNFSNIISYEQRDYALRILKIILIYFLPLIIIFLNFIIEKIKEKSIYLKISALIISLLLINISFYLSYPRIDKYYNSRGFNTSYLDLQAVLEIEKDAENNKYFVLANQQLSAAALYEFGFEKNFLLDNKEIYFYPVPTGGVLYNYYLEMVYNKPSRENINKALDSSNSSIAYLIINKYWNQSLELINIAKTESDYFWDIDNEIFIFKFYK